MAARLKERYDKQLRAELMKELGFANPMQAPRLEKIVVNMGLGEAINNGRSSTRPSSSSPRSPARSRS